MREPVPETFTLYRKLPEADIFYEASSATALVVSKANFIPMEAFKNIFSAVSSLLDEENVGRVIFDKRSLTIFHQPSMEWYYLEWKPRMLELHSLNRHDKILPKDELFRQSVNQARGKIYQAHPRHIIHKIEPVYFENLQEALAQQK